ncbi:hypothetical protein FQZ97_1227970 [compost metagenome]
MDFHGTAQCRQGRCAIGQIGHQEMQGSGHPVIGRAQDCFVAINQQQRMAFLDEGMGNRAPEGTGGTRNHDQTGHS